MTDSPIARILGRVPSGIFILTVRHEEEETGMISSWVMQAGFEPPMVTVAIRHGRYVADWILAGAPFALNMLPEKQKGLLRHFARGFERGEPAFAGLDFQRSPRGVPILAHTVGHLECEPANRNDSGDHHIFLAKVVGGALTEHLRPMVHIRNTGLRY